jgi:hypothetical protein
MHLQFGTQKDASPEMSSVRSHECVLGGGGRGGGDEVSYCII